MVNRAMGEAHAGRRVVTKRLATGPRRGFDEVYGSEMVGVTRLAFLLVRSQAVAEELAQDAFLRLYEHWDVVDNPPGFVRTVVVRLALTWQSRHQMEQRRLAVVGSGTASSVAAPEMDETWEALGRLRPDRRAVLVLRFYAQMRHGEIAAALGCPTATVRSRTRRALSDLRKELSR